MLENVVSCTHRKRNMTPPEIYQYLRDVGHQLDPNQSKEIIESVLRCSLMLDWQTRNVSTSVLRFNNSISINKVVSSIFPRTTYTLDRKDSRIPFNFTVAYMVRLCKLEIKWTHTLQDHLRISRSIVKSRNIKTLHIFTYIPALTMMRTERS